MECVICYDNTNYKTNCGHYVCNDCTDRMIINKILCPICRQRRTDICIYCKDRNQICNCSNKYIFDNNDKWFSLRYNLWRYVNQCFGIELVHNMNLVHIIYKEIDNYIMIFKAGKRETYEKFTCKIIRQLIEQNIFFYD